jgi:hypothetical protein
LKVSRAYIKALEDAGLIPKAPLRARVAKPHVQAIPPVLRRQYPEWPGRFVLEIPGHLPTSSNDLRCHPLKQSNLKARDRRAFGKAAVILGIPMAISRRRVTLIVTDAWRRGKPDDDAYLKAVFDSLVTNYLLIDDKREWMEFDWPPTYETGERSTTIILEDIEPIFTL